MRLLAAVFLLLSTSTSVAFAQEDGVWGFMVFDHEGKFVTAKWPEQESFVAGSSPDAYLELEGLAPLHAYFELRDGEFMARPMFETDVLVNGARIESDTIFDTRDTITLGRYRMNFVLATDPPLEELPPAAHPVVDATDPLLAADRADAARKGEFEKKGYAFCHDEDFGKDGTPGVDFCVIFDESSSEVCPKARETCPGWKPYEPPPGGGGSGGAGDVGSGGKDGKGKGASGGSARRVMRRRVMLPIPKELGAILLVLVGGALIFWFVKSMMSAGWEGEEVELDADELSEAAKNLQALPEARSNVLVKLAERALGRGDPKEAAILLHLAVLRHLDDEGLARYHPSKTNGDYLRAIRRLPELRDLFRGIANQTERVRFGDGRVDAGVIERSILDAKALLRRAKPDSIGGAMPGASLLVLVGLLAPLLQACPLGGEDPALPAFYAHGPAGMSALPVILRESGLDVSLGHSRFSDVEPGVGVVVFRTSAAAENGWPQEMRLDELLDRNLAVVVIDDRARSSFFLPTDEMIDWGEPSAVRLEVSEPDPDSFCSWRVADLRERHLGDAAPVLPRGRRILWDGLSVTATVTSHFLRLHPLIAYEGEAEVSGKSAAVAYAAERYAEERLPGCMYVFSDRDLFTNASLTRTTNARFVASFFSAITPPGQKIVILDRLDSWSTASGAAGGGGGGGGGNDDPSPARTMKASNMMPFVLQSLLTLVLLFVLLGAAFGPLRDPVKREHKAFVEHVEAIGRQYARTGQAGLTHAAQSLAKLVVMRNRDRIRGGTSGGWIALARHLAEQHELPEDDVKAALRLGIDGVSELGTPRVDDPNPSSERMLKTLSRLLGVRRKQVTEKPHRRRFGIGRKR